MADLSAPETLFKRGHLLIYGTTNLTSSQDVELNNWWTHEHLPERLGIPGFVGARRYCGVGVDFRLGGDEAKEEKTAGADADGQEVGGGQMKGYLVWYQTRSIEVLSSDAYMQKLNSPTPGTKKMMSVIAGLKRSACRVLDVAEGEEWSTFKTSAGGRGGVDGGMVLHVECQAPVDEGERRGALSRMKEDMRSRWLSAKDVHVLSVLVLEPDEVATQAGNSSASYENVDFKKQGDEKGSIWHVVIDFADSVASSGLGRYREFGQHVVHGLERLHVLVHDLRLYGLIAAAHA